MTTAVALGADASSRKARRPELVRGMTASEAWVVIASECIEHWRTNEALLLESRAMPHLHQTRVGLRRLRSSFSLFRPLLRRAPHAEDVVHRLRHLALPLGRARDLDVLLAGDLLDDQPAHHADALAQERERAYDVVFERLGSSAWRKAGRRLDRVVADAPWGLADDPAVVDLAARALEKRWRRVAGVHDRIAEMSPADRHEVRIEAKKLRYGCEFFADLYAVDSDETVTIEGSELSRPLAYAWHAEQVQTALGAVNDHHTADELLRSVGAAAPGVDEDALVAEGVAACHRLASLEPFWR